MKWECVHGKYFTSLNAVEGNERGLFLTKPKNEEFWSPSHSFVLNKQFAGNVSRFNKLALWLKVDWLIRSVYGLGWIQELSNISNAFCKSLSLTRAVLLVSINSPDACLAKETIIIWKKNLNTVLYFPWIRIKKLILLICVAKISENLILVVRCMPDINQSNNNLILIYATEFTKTLCVDIAGRMK